MKYNKTLALLPALLLVACGGEEQTINQPAGPGSVVYSYPADGQISVSPESDAVLRFSHPVSETNAELENKIRIDANGAPVAFSVAKIDGGQSLRLSFSDALAPSTDYSLTFSEPVMVAGNRAVGMPNAHGEDGVQFRTRGSFSGIASMTNQSETFEIASQVPAPEGDFTAMNFSTFRLTMTQPIHPDWKALGGSIELLDRNGQPVPATVLVKGDRIALDPCVTPDPQACGSKDDVLTSGSEYTLSIQNLPNVAPPARRMRFSKDWTFTPRDTGPTVVLQQSAVDSGLGSGGDPEQATRSILNGEIINGVTLNSVLQGKAGPSQQTGDLFAELAYAPAFNASEALPLRIAKGSVLRSSSLDVLVGGAVPVLDAATGILQTTGDIKVTMLSDASGYMSPNAYTDDMNAPRHITLFMDVSMNTDNAQPNAALSQTLMGVELRGIAIVKDGVLTIDAIATVEPGLLGQEYTDSTIAFHLQAATDVDSVLDAENLRLMDGTAPSLVSWTPGAADAIPDTRQSIHRPGDPVILFFDEPLAPESVEDGITLSENGSALTDLNIRIDGTTIALNPEGGLKHGADYRVQINGVTDLAGNVAALAPLEFRLDPIDNGSVAKRPPLALTTYPGFPCETNHAALNLENGVLGQCYDARGEAFSRGRSATVDTLPVPTMPENRPITVVFSKTINPDSVIEGTTFTVEKVSQNGTGGAAVSSQGPVSGRLELSAQRLRFYPDEPWTPGEHYRYTLASSEAASACTAGSYSAICDTDGLALKTDILEGLNDPNAGPDPLTVYFTGTEQTDTVFTALRNLPIRDTNSNFLIDCNPGTNGSGNRTFQNVDNCLEPFDHLGNDIDGWEAAANSSKLRVRDQLASASGLAAPDAPAQVGCEAGEGLDCQRGKFIYQTYALNTEVKGPGTFDPDPEIAGDEIAGILVDLYPTLLTTTSISVFTKIRALGFIPLQEETVTNTQVLRMRYAKDDPACTGGGCARNSLIPGVITEGENGQPVFITNADLLIDAPDMAIPLGGQHDLYGRPFTLKLKGDVTFFDDGRMQIEQRNSNLVGANDELMVTANTAGLWPGGGVVTLRLPLEIPVNGTYLNFISNPVKDIPVLE